MTTLSKTVWNYEEQLQNRQSSILGYEVAATDGDIGKISIESTEADLEHVVVDTGFWIFSSQRLIPAAAITDVDHDNQRVSVKLSKEQIKDAPDWNGDSVLNEESQNQHVDYYTAMVFPPGPTIH